MTLIDVCGVSLRLDVPDGAGKDAILARFARRAHGYAETLPERRDLPVRVEGRAALVEYEGKLGRVELDAGVVQSPPSPVLCDALVRIAASWKLAQRGAAFLHASAVRVATPHGNGAVVFFGKSTAGKSTLAAAYGDFISDELSLLEAPATAGRAWMVSPTPWWHGQGEPAPLARLVWLVRGERPSVRAVRGGELLRALLQETGRYVRVPEYDSRIFDLCARVAARGALRVAAGEGRVVDDVRAALAMHAREAA